MVQHLYTGIFQSFPLDHYRSVHLMLLFVCLTEFKLTAGDCLFNEETQKAMASAAKRILNSLTELEKGTGARIEHKIVYGLHWDHLKLRIVAHFMNRPGSESWNFCQVVIAQHLISLNPDWNVLYDHTIDDTFIDRWRITCALFAVRREIEHLKSTVQGQPGYSSGLQSRTSKSVHLNSP